MVYKNEDYKKTAGNKASSQQMSKNSMLNSYYAFAFGSDEVVLSM